MGINEMQAILIGADEDLHRDHTMASAEMRQVHVLKSIGASLLVIAQLQLDQARDYATNGVKSRA